MIEKEKLTTKKALELLQKIRYYDENGNVVFLMDESEELDYISDICKKYEGTKKQIMKKMVKTSLLESVGIINVNTPEKNRKRKTIYKAEVKLRPMIKIKRHNNYK